jgi:hypothetical protein
MADENDGTRQWVVEPPPAAGEISLYVACGDDIELTREQQEALGALLRSLEARDPEVVGHDTCSNNLTDCIGLKCGKVTCSWLECSLNRPKAAATGATGWDLMGSFNTGVA